MTKKILKLLLFPFFLSICGASASTALANLDDSNALYFKRLSIEHGLNSRWISALAQDERGFIWIGSSNGLQRYDGYQFLDVGGNNQIILGSEVYDLLLDSKHRLWVANEKSAYEINTATLKTRAVAFEGDQFSESSSTPVLQMKETKDGSIWFARWDGLFKIEPGRSIANKVTQGFTELDFSEDGILSMELLDDQLLIGTSKGLYITDLSNRFLRRIIYTTDSDRKLNESRIRNIAATEHFVWIATDKGLFKLSRDELTRQDNIKSELALNIEINRLNDSPKSIWVATIDGIYEIDKSTEQLSPFITPQQQHLTHNNNSYEEVLVDSDGYLWLGTSGRGIYQWSPITRSVTSALVTSTLPARFGQSSNIWSIKVSNDQYWIGTENGLFLLNNDLTVAKEYQVTPESWHYSERAVFDIIEVNDRFWLSTFYDIREFDPVTGQVSSLEKEHPNLFKTFGLELTIVRRLSPDLLAIGYSNGLKVYSISKKAFIADTFKASDDKEFQQRIAFIEKDPLGDTWVASGSTLYRLDIDTQRLTQVFEQKFKIGDPYVAASAVYRMNKNELWVAYAGAGLFQLNLNQNGQVVSEKHYGSQHGLQDMTLYSLYYENNVFWISTHDGIILFNPDSVTFTRLAAFDGVYEHEFNQFAHRKLNNNKLAFGSINGLYLLNTQEIINQLPKRRKVIISQITQLNTNHRNISTYNDFSQLQIAPDDSGIKVYVTDFNFFKQNPSLFSFYITGKKDFELKSGSDNSVILAGLPPGQYFLSVSSSSGDQLSSLKVPLNWLPPIWRSNTALGLYIVLLILFTMMLLHFFAQQSRKRQLLNSFATNNVKLLDVFAEHQKQNFWLYQLADNTIQVINHKDYSTIKTMDVNEWINQLNHFDRSHFITQWNSFINLQSSELACEISFKSNTKQPKWYELFGKAVETADGQVTKAIGAYRNITEEMSCRGQQALFKSVFDQTFDLIIVLSEKLIIEQINTSTLKTTLFDADELIDCSIDILYSNQLPVDYYTQLKDKTLELQNVTEESWIRCKTGIDIPVLIHSSYTLINDKNYFVLSISDLSQIAKLQNKLNQLVHYDPLTNLPNRTLLLDRLEHAIDRANHLKSQIAVLILNLDHFKTINDSLGHKSGDELLIEVATRIAHCINPDDTIARIGGDEFAIIFEDTEQIDRLNNISQRLVEIMKQPFKIGSDSISISLSIGISLYPEDGRENDVLIKHADMAMHHAKKVGKSNFQYFTQSLNDLAKEQLSMEQNLHKALANNEFYPVFQPRFNIDNEISGFEVLLRWRTSSGKHISPDIFIPVAEKLNLILPLTEWLIEYVCNLLKEFESLDNNFEFSFNLSQNHFINYDLVKMIKKQIVKCDVSYSKIELEINENTLMMDPENTREVIKSLKSLGVKIAVDDFGTGYSSLSHLKLFNVDRLVIDRSFVWGIGNDEHSETIVSSMIQLANTLQLEILAEGIESPEQLNFLKNQSCHYYQGYLLSKPLTQDHLLSLVNKD